MQQFIETTLNTEFGTFIFRVYQDSPGKETIALYSEKLDPTQAPLVRVHSECITGDTFGSRRCDCGPQLNKALEDISKDGNGILIYLRQEGRGIGLFEKVKAYQLQDQGYDTYEANVMLGHLPDARTYETAKAVLDDFKVERIRLLTNNPSKISEIEQAGIEVAERIPLLISANPHNTHYLLSKKTKFNHLF
ncbi:MAG: bifunctional 3,4-dihydroxy-2-butanone-4-phosphate synthase/GTP cyclohydrolase [Gammaproteobacteria bacterium]|jgi:3,4-dihydroxy 2-butanone 4-phosphate synthase/GTP cyclohydrolase II|nr:bifunctional 3,4-dihydroxy-2-butanone-4-phosphate synthase/GTP cyclohydrolase [Gammaproteobacteria bacterium]